MNTAVRIKIVLYSKENNETYVYHRIGNVMCKHSDGSYCVRLGSDINLPKSEHHADCYHVKAKQIEVSPYTNDVSTNLKKQWSNLIFRKVGKIFLRMQDLEYIRRYQYKEPPECINLTGLDLSQNEDSVKTLSQISNMSVGYTHYHGYCEPVNDPNGTIEGIYFQKKNKAHISFESQNMGGWIDSPDAEPPNSGKLLCGVVTRMDDIYYYHHWFECSVQFYRLYLLIMYGRECPEFYAKNKNQILDMLETNKEMRVIAPIGEKRKTYIKTNEEPSSIKYPDIYKAMAQLFVFQDDIPVNQRRIPETYWLPSHPDIYRLNLLMAFG